MTGRFAGGNKASGLNCDGGIINSGEQCENKCRRLFGSRLSLPDHVPWSILSERITPGVRIGDKNGSPFLTIVHQTVLDFRPNQSQQMQIESTDLENTTVVDDVEIIDMVLRRRKLFQQTDTFAGYPGGVDGDVECVGLAEEEREHRKDPFRMFLGRFRVRGLSTHVSDEEVTVWNPPAYTTTELVSQVLWERGYQDSRSLIFISSEIGRFARVQ